MATHAEMTTRDADGADAAEDNSRSLLESLASGLKDKSKGKVEAIETLQNVGDAVGGDGWVKEHGLMGQITSLRKSFNLSQLLDLTTTLIKSIATPETTHAGLPLSDDEDGGAAASSSAPSNICSALADIEQSTTYPITNIGYAAVECATFSEEWWGLIKKERPEIKRELTPDKEEDLCLLKKFCNVKPTSHYREQEEKRANRRDGGEDLLALLKHPTEFRAFVTDKNVALVRHHEPGRIHVIGPEHGIILDPNATLAITTIKHSMAKFGGKGNGTTQCWSAFVKERRDREKESNRVKREAERQERIRGQKCETAKSALKSVESDLKTVKKDTEEWKTLMMQRFQLQSYLFELDKDNFKKPKATNGLKGSKEMIEHLLKSPKPRRKSRSPTPKKKT